MNRKAIALIEIIVVLIIIGVIAGMGLIRYSGVTEESLDKEAKANLKLMQTAEKLYHVEFNPYYYPSPGSGVTPNLAQINDNLKLTLPTSSIKWTYQINTAGTATATRTSGGGRQWTLTINADEPTCSGCP